MTDTATESAVADPEMFGRPLSVYAGMSDEEIIELGNIGNRKLKQIRQAIAEFGIKPAIAADVSSNRPRL